MTENLNPQPESTPQETEAAFSPKPSLKERLSGLLMHPKAPYWFGAGLLVAAGAFAVYMKGPLTWLTPFRTPMVTFDPVRFNNAQRAAASILVMRPDADTALTMTQVAKHAEAVIREEAHGAVVLVKQTVVAPVGIPDITDAVLNRFGLPTNVPTITTDLKFDNLEDVAPTDSAFSAGKLREDYRLELETKRSKLAEQQAKQTGQANVLP